MLPMLALLSEMFGTWKTAALSSVHISTVILHLCLVRSTLFSVKIWEVLLVEVAESRPFFPVLDKSAFSSAKSPANFA